MDQSAGFDSAPQLAASLLGTGSRRFRHTVGVASAARAAAPGVPEDDVELLVAAAWLHDIGYAEAVADTGFHPLDGARYLQRIGAPQRLCRLVAQHTASPIEARGRGLLDALSAEFPAERSPTADALTYADMTTGPDGTPISAVERVAEILVRYPQEHVVHRSITEAAPMLLDVVARFEVRLAAATDRGPSGPGRGLGEGPAN
jgi:putative nucleotidyltransferase with HDIG domain